MSTSTDVNRPLEGLVVAELGHRIAAGACGGLLAALGAAVVLVEPAAPSQDAKWRHRATMAYGKLSIIDEAADVQALLERADIVLLSSDLAERDLAERDLAVWDAGRPARQILCDITAFGHSGPLSGRGYSEASIQALSGVADTTGPRQGRPAVTGAPFLEMETAVYAVAAIMAALRVRRRHGAGQRIDMAIYDIGVNALLTFLPLHTAGRPATRNGNRHPTAAPWNSYRTTDGWVLICAPTNDQWRKLCAVMGRPELAADARFLSPSARYENVEALDDTIGAWVASVGTGECLKAVSAQGIPCSSIIALSDLPAEPNLVHRGMVHRVADPISGRMVHVPGSPFRIAGARPAAQSAIPRPGEHRAAVAGLAAAQAPQDRVHGDRPVGEPPLHGLRVVEIGMNTVAPLAGRQLGALGADVVKVEPPSGDVTRINAPLREDGQAFVFILSNTDKRGLVLDLSRPEDAATLWRLLETADVVIENLKPGSLARLGFGAEQVRGRFPRIVYCSVNGFGFDTVYPGRPALDTVIQGMSGAMSATVLDGMPTKAGISISDQLGGQFGLAGLLAALELRERSGEGVHLDLAMHDGSAWACQTRWNDPDGSAGALGQVIETADGHAVVVEQPDGSRQTVPVLDVAQVLAHPQTQARNLIKEVPTADGSHWQVLNCPLRLLSTPGEVRSAMPRLGFLDEALAGELGLGSQTADLMRRTA